MFATGAAAILMGNDNTLTTDAVADELGRLSTKNKVMFKNDDDTSSPIDTVTRSPNNLLYIGSKLCSL